MIKRSIFLLVFLTAFCTAQTSSDTLRLYSTAKLDSIRISGNTTTLDYIILNELTFSTGQAIDSVTLFYNRERIYSLGLFNHVWLYFENQNPGILNIVVEESWYIWPIPFVELVDKDWKKISYGVDFQLKNFRGRNENLRAKASLGYNPSLRLIYTVPYFSRDENLFAETQLNYGSFKNSNSVAEDIYGGDFNVKYFNVLVSTGKRFSQFDWFAPQISYEWYSYPISAASMSARDIKNFGLLGIGLNYKYDSRDLAQFPKSGEYLTANYLIKGFGSSTFHYQRIVAEGRKYIQVFSDITLKAKALYLQLIGDDIPYHDIAYIGLGEKVRGAFTKVKEGKSSVSTSLEWNYPLIHEYNINLNLPIIPDKLQSYRTALYHHFFVDAAVVKKQDKPLSIQDGMIGFGTGLSLIILPYRVVTLEYALNDKGKGEFIFQLDVSF